MEKPPPDDLEEQIHCARLRAKRLAAVLELARPHMPGRNYRREKARILKSIQPLAERRDEHVLRGRLGKHGPVPRESPQDWAKLKQALHHLPRPLDWLAGRATISGLERFAKPGLERTLRKARKAMRKARDSGRPRAFHRWRRWAKCVSLQLLALEQAGIRANKRACCELDRLQHDLGEHHDLTLARKYGRRHDAPSQTLRKLRHDRTKIEARIIKSGLKLLDHSRASAFVARQPRGGF